MTGEIVIACSNCGRHRRAFDQWGSATTDAKNRVYCSYECAWTILIHEDQVSSHHHSMGLPSTSAAPSRKRLTRRRKPKSSSSATSSASSSSNDLTQGVKEWNALFGMSALLGMDN